MAVRIPDRNLKLALVGSLIDENILPPLDELVKALGLDEEREPAPIEGYDLEVDVALLEALVAMPIDGSALAKVQSLRWHYGNLMTDHLAPDWNGEGGFFNIRDLTGIEACTDLRWLRVGCDDITSFEPLLGIATLKSVDFAGGQLRDLSLFEKLPALRTVSLEGVLLTSTEENVAAFRALCDRGVWVHFDCEVDGALRDAIIARDKARWQAYAAAVEPRIERARRALEEGRLDDAEANIEEVLEMDRDEVRAVTLSGLVAMKRGDMPLALAHLSRAALMEPESLEANEAFFEACMKVGNHQNALFAISNQIAVHDTPGRRRARAEVHAHMGNYDEAVEDTTAVIRSIDENEPGGDAQGLARDYNKRGEYNFYRNNKEAALADWTKAAELGSVEAKRRLHSGPGEKKR